MNETMAVDSNLRWSSLLHDFAKHFTDEDVRNIKQLLYTLYKTDVPDLAEKLDNIESHDRLFLILSREKLISMDDTELLHYLLKEIHPRLLEDLAEFEKFRAAEIERLGEARTTCSSKYEPFVGRDRAMEDIEEWLHRRTVRMGGVCISGLPGMGKTRLAREACVKAMGDAWKVCPVDLKGKDTIDSIVPAIMISMGIETDRYNPEENTDKLIRHIKSHKKGSRMIIWLDNVDKPLEPDGDVFRSEFVKFLDSVIDTCNPKIKIIITSRFGLDKKYGNEFLTIRLDSDEYVLNLEEAAQYIQGYSTERELSREEGRSLGRACGMCPLLMKMMVGCLTDPNVTVEELVKCMEKNPVDTLRGLCESGLTADNTIEVGFRALVRTLNEDQRRNLVMLTVIPGTFTIEAAASILGIQANKDFSFLTKGKIRVLQKINLIGASETDRGELMTSSAKYPTRYSIHFLIRTCVCDILIEEDPTCRKHHDNAIKRYAAYYTKKMKKLNKLVSTDHRRVMREKEMDATNFHRVIELISEKTEIDVPEIQDISGLLDLFLNSKERYDYYHKACLFERRRGNAVKFSQYRCWEVTQLLQRGHSIEALYPMVDEALRSLEGVPNQRERKEVQIAFARCYHCMGDIFHERGKAKDALKWLHRSKQISERFPEEGDLTVNLLTSISLATHKTAITAGASERTIEPSVVKKALQYGKQAVDLRRKLTGSDLHYEMPSLIQNLAAYHHDLNNYDTALTLYKYALKILNDLNMTNTQKSHTIMKNIATTYRSMDRYDDAATYATLAMNGRKQLLGDNPNTARSICTVAIAHMDLEQYAESKRYLVEALEMEERLWRSGKPHSAAWKTIKQQLKGVCLLLGNPQTEIMGFTRRFEDAEDENNRGQPAPRREFKGDDESDSSSDDEEGVPMFDVRALIQDDQDLKSLLASSNWDITMTGYEGPTYIDMAACMVITVAIAAVLVHFYYGHAATPDEVD
ncbi:uncharacterized protein [Ptychodera flava]|uniref:uncharacterized protein n=1 Tax=Ptychodera flava TaxID=63121 RepID=UPI00396AA6D1